MSDPGLSRARPFDANSPFLARDAAVAGLSTARLRSKEFQRIFHGCYIRREIPLDFEVLCRAALLTTRSYAISHHSAARWWGTPADSIGAIDVAVPWERRDRVDGIRTHRYRNKPAVTWLRGLRVTTPAQTFLDLARSSSLVDLVAVGDALTHQGSVSPAELQRAAAEFHGSRAGRAREAAHLIDPRAESKQESATRILFVTGGLPAPEVNFRIVDGDGKRRRIDLAYPEVKAGAEYDGSHHLEQWEEDILRREAIARAGGARSP